VLVIGLAAFKQGNKKLSQQMMRTRVLFQGGTVLLMLGSSGELLIPPLSSAACPPPFPHWRTGARLPHTAGFMALQNSDASTGK
jgi:hypothetical protein